jgi:hypothetical protein
MVCLECMTWIHREKTSARARSFSSSKSKSKADIAFVHGVCSRLVANGDRPSAKEVSLSDASLIGGESFEKLRTVLTMRLPGDLQAAFQEEVQGLRSTAYSGVELLDALDEAHAGLGVAIGRGTTGDDARYEQLGKLVAWLYEELGRPQNSRYAVVVRAATAISESEQKRSEAGLQSLVLRNPTCRPEELDSLRPIGPDIDVVDE